MARSIFNTRRTDLMKRKHIADLVLHLYNPERWPLNLEAHLAKLTGDGMVLATAVIESHQGGDPEFLRHAEMLLTLRGETK